MRSTLICNKPIVKSNVQISEFLFRYIIRNKKWNSLFPMVIHLRLRLNKIHTEAQHFNCLSLCITQN